MTETILEEATRIVDGARKEKYGPPVDNHGATADFFRVWLERRYGTKVALDARDVCMFNVLQKVSREAHHHHRDNLVDIAGYMRNVEIVEAAPFGLVEGVPSDEVVTFPPEDGKYQAFEYEPVGTKAVVGDQVESIESGDVYDVVECPEGKQSYDRVWVASDGNRYFLRHGDYRVLERKARAAKAA